MYSDVLYVPYYKHYLEWAGIILGILAVLFSLLYVIVTISRRLWNKKQLNKFFLSQHLLTLLLLTNVIWIVYKALSLVSYSSLKPFLTLNLVYVIIAFIINGFLLVQFKNKRLSKSELLVRIMTIVFTVILCVNVLYWEFYY